MNNRTSKQVFFKGVPYLFFHSNLSNGLSKRFDRMGQEKRREINCRRELRENSIKIQYFEGLCIKIHGTYID